MHLNNKLSKEIIHRIFKETKEKVEVKIIDNAVYLDGNVSSYDKVLKAGFIAASFNKLRGVVSNLHYPLEEKIIFPEKVSDRLNGMEFDVVVVGAGVIGAAIARELSKFNLSIAVLERNSDIGVDQTAHNNGMIHPAFLTKHGTLKWEMNYKGNAMYDRVVAELDVPFKRIGTLIVAENLKEELMLFALHSLVKWHRDPSPKILNREELDRVEPGLAPHIKKGLLVWNTGVISPFELTIAYMENAISNGAKLFLRTSVTGVYTENSCVKAVETTQGTIKTHCLINAAGLYADKIAEFAGDRFFTIHPRRGATIIFDKTYQPMKTVLGSFSMRENRNPHSKGGGFIPTIDGNLQLGPTACEVEDREDTATTFRDINELLDKFAPILSRLKPEYAKASKDKIITYFAGARAATFKEDFIIEPSQKIKGLIHVAGIQSPGLASAPAIAERVYEIVRDEVNPDVKAEFNPARKRFKPFSEMDESEITERIKEDSLYGHIICRCEHVSEKEIVNVLHDDIPVESVDAIKRRTRTGMGRCQGGFCLPRVMGIIEQEKKLNKECITKNGGKSFILNEKTKRGEK